MLWWECGGLVHLGTPARGCQWHPVAPPGCPSVLASLPRGDCPAASSRGQCASGEAKQPRCGEQAREQWWRCAPAGELSAGATPALVALSAALRRQTAQADRAWGQGVAGALRTRQPRPAGAQMPEAPALTSLPTPVHTGSFCQCEPPALHRVTRLPAQGRSLGLPGPPCSHHRTHPAAQGQCHPWPAGPPARPSPRRLCPQPVAGRCGPGWPPVGSCDGSRFSTAGHPSATPAHGPSWVLRTPEPLIFFSHGS